MKDTIRIGGASGYWGDASLAAGQLLAGGRLDFLVFDYLAEITMGIMARMRAGDPDAGFAPDFVYQAMAPNLAEIARQKIKVVSNAGGVNPDACATALRGVIEKQGLSLKVAVVTGDDLHSRASEFQEAGHCDMFSGAAFPDQAKISSINAYLGAFPIAKALARGADIVITGRCIDSAVTLGACINVFGWQADQFDRLAAGSLAGHILECGTQASGGNFTDWHMIKGGFDTIGYPIAEVAADGRFTVGKPDGTGGLVSVATVAEQMVYEIGDPQTYALPDVTCDFSQVELAQQGDDLVAVSGTMGRAPTETYKTCLTWQDGFRGGHLFGYYGIDAESKAASFAKAVLKRSVENLRQQNMPEFSETSVEILGAEAQFGANRQSPAAREVNVKIAVKHPDAKGVGLFLKDATGLGLSAPPGLSGFAGARPKPSPVMALFSFLVPKSDVVITIADDGGAVQFTPASFAVEQTRITRPAEPEPPEFTGERITVPLINLAWARSGDKGDSANIGVIARVPEYFPHIWAALSEDVIAEVYGHFLKGDIARYLIPGTNAMNILLTRVLGGGGAASLRNDPQGKGYSQLLLARKIQVPKSLLEGRT